MWGRWRLKQQLDELDQKLKRDDDIVHQLANVVLQLREATHEAETVLRLLKRQNDLEAELKGRADDRGDPDRRVSGS